jgi:DNA-binding NarL/FixJ family response regulator
MKFLLADDHHLVRETLKDYIEQHWPDTEVLQAATLPEAEEVALRHKDSLNLILLDLRMPGMQGLKGLEKMCQNFPHIPVTLISGAMHKSQAIEALNLGACGVLPKTLRPQALLNAIKLVLSGERYLPAMLLTDDVQVDSLGDTQKYPAQNTMCTLTPRETEVLDLLAKGYSNKEIARTLDLQEITIKVHLSSVFRKLGASNRTQAVTRAIQTGLVVCEPTEKEKTA